MCGGFKSIADKADVSQAELSVSIAAAILFLAFLALLSQALGAALSFVIEFFASLIRGH